MTMYSKKEKEFLHGIIKLTSLYNQGLITNKDYRFSLKQESREIDLYLKIFNFSWMNSILLRILKN